MQKEPYKLKVAREQKTMDTMEQYRAKAHDNWSILEDFGLFLWPV